MLRKITILWWLLSCTVLCLAQDVSQKSASQSKPDLSGTWELDKSKSKLGKKMGGITLIISQREPEIRMIRKSTLDGNVKNQELIYYGDGRGERNPTPVRDELTESDFIETTTKWEKNKLVSKAIYLRKSPRGSFEMEVTNQWELSSDGTMLTNTTTIDAPKRVTGTPDGIIFVRDQSPRKMVFARVP